MSVVYEEVGDWDSFNKLIDSCKEGIDPFDDGSIDRGTMHVFTINLTEEQIKKINEVRKGYNMRKIKFEGTPDGYKKAVKYLKKVDKEEYISGDGYSIVHGANYVWEKEKEDRYKSSIEYLNVPPINPSSVKGEPFNIDLDGKD